jgi:NADP-dependent 3-hydroxy acid dehydrogenase YdfG
LARTRDQLLGVAPEAEVLMLHVDIGDEQSVLNSVEKTVAKFGRLDYACNVAGIELGNMPIQDMRSDDFDRIVQVNAYGVSQMDILYFECANSANSPFS